MKKLTLAIMTFSLALFGFGAAASAGNVYPTNPPSVSVSNPTPAPGSTITVTMNGCVEGESVQFTLEGETASGVTAGGSASAQIKVPTTPGTYTGTATCASGTSAAFSITVTTPSGGLPATGSSGMSSTVMISMILFLVGAGLLVVSQVRRRNPVAT
jgi:LPXTG-motif cell wall-anchored protein